MEAAQNEIDHKPAHAGSEKYIPPSAYSNHDLVKEMAKCAKDTVSEFFSCLKALEDFNRGKVQPGLLFAKHTRSLNR